MGLGPEKLGKFLVQFFSEANGTKGNRTERGEDEWWEQKGGKGGTKGILLNKAWQS